MDRGGPLHKTLEVKHLPNCPGVCTTPRCTLRHFLCTGILQDLVVRGTKAGSRPEMQGRAGLEKREVPCTLRMPRNRPTEHGWQTGLRRASAGFALPPLERLFKLNSTRDKCPSMALIWDTRVAPQAQSGMRAPRQKQRGRSSTLKEHSSH